MPAYHIHISGLVQGVGFRPLVHQLALKLALVGWVKNEPDGVHIHCQGEVDTMQQFYQHIIQNPPQNSIIIAHSCLDAEVLSIQGFQILPSTNTAPANLMLTPDLAICDACKKAIKDPANRRYGYAFTTCLQCGPRYSITDQLPFDRENTTMRHLEQCPSCLKEYHDPSDIRHFCQTNSCKVCATKLQVYSKDLVEINDTQNEVFRLLTEQLVKGNIIAVKGVGGFLLVCDASNKKTIQTLRTRKTRPTKPFALLYADIEMLQADLSISPTELNALKDKSGPIVLCKTKQHPENNICLHEIAPGLQSIGAMLPSSPLLQILADHFGKPMVATSANFCGGPIVYQDKIAKAALLNIADYLLIYDREIIAPQNDSIIQFSSRGQKIILRRSRGLAPNYYPAHFNVSKESVLAMGSELKSSFAITKGALVFVSQFLGNQQSIESQMSFEISLNQVSKLTDFVPAVILVDSQPDFHTSKNGLKRATELDSKYIQIQHHEAHFAAVMAENKLLELDEPVLGFIWDGSGLGNDGQIWGGEIFLYDQRKINRCAHLDYFPQLKGNQMNKEPRLSALSILKDFPVAQKLIKKHFTEAEWTHYQQILNAEPTIQTSSMGRLIDAVACILGIKPIMQYEGEAALLLEALANKSPYPSYDSYHLPFSNGIIDWKPLIQELLHDWLEKEPNEVIAWKFFYSLAKAISKISSHFFIDKLAFSGGVFQNALLTDMVIEILQHKRQLHFHKQLSPNDECIGFGQLAWYSCMGHNEIEHQKRYQLEFASKSLSHQSTDGPILVNFYSIINTI